MKIDCLVAEIGSTTTTVHAFNVHDEHAFLGKGMAKTSVDTDVREGLNGALEHLKNNLGADTLDYREMFASSSAAGGLRMTVSGLVYEMTVKAAKEAALNAGANLHLVTAGDLTTDDIERIERIRPNIILVAGGTDYGEKRTAFDNLLKIEKMGLDIPLIYAGNVDNHYRIEKHFETSSQKRFLKIVENVYPRVDYLNIAPLRKAIYETFEEHIVHAPGMQHIRDLVGGTIVPTPGAVMEATMLLHEDVGHLVAIDVGGATTDVHSMTEPSDEFKAYAEGEPKEKRTVEGDLGVYVNRETVMKMIDRKTLLADLGVDEATLDALSEDDAYIPKTDQAREFIRALAGVCMCKAMDRHAGDLKKVYTTGGRKMIPEGRDLTQVGTVILTGGALVHLDGTETLLRRHLKNRPGKLFPKEGVRIVKDEQYLMSSIGVLSFTYPEAALNIFRRSIGL